MIRNPIQPIIIDKDNVPRFKENKIVTHLLDWCSERGHSLNALAMMDFDADDRCQLAQLIGYSLAGYGELSYVDDEAYEAAAELLDRLASIKAK